MMDVKHNEDERGNPNAQTENIDEGRDLVTPEYAQGNGEKAS
jgi:hypothetical protein